MIQFRTTAMAAFGATLLTAMPTAAVVKIATYTGTISSGLDSTGVFAAPGTDLPGYSFTATYTYDKLRGSLNVTDVGYDVSFGSGLNSPIIASNITINGVTKSISNTGFGYVGVTLPPWTPYFYIRHDSGENFDDGATSMSRQLTTRGVAASLPATLDQNWGPVSVSNSLNEFNGMSFYGYDYLLDTTTEAVSARFGPDMVYTVTGDSVPEPTSWALMIAGFGMVGVALRRRETVAV